MKNKKILSLLLALFLTLGFFTACTNESGQTAQNSNTQNTEQSEEQAAAFPVTITDMMGREVQIKEEPQKIITIEPSLAEIVYSIDAGDRVIARGTFVDFPEQVRDLPIVATGMDMNAEEIIALEPDLVLMSDMATDDTNVQKLESAGIHVIVTKNVDIAGTYQAIDIVGKAVGKSAEAQKLIDTMKSDFGELSANAEDNKGKSVYFEVSPLEYGLWTAGKGTFMDEVAAMLGLENVFADVNGWSEISEEEVIKRNPDFIITTTMPTDTNKEPEKEILSRKGWEGITAVSEENVLNIKDSQLTRPSPRLVEGAKMLSDFVNENK